MRPADPSALDAASPARAAHQEALQRLFDFTPAELAANRAGHLTLGQWPLPVGFFLGAALTATALFLAGFLVRRAREAWRSGNGGATVRSLALALPVLAVGALVAAALVLPLARDWIARRACSAEGLTQGFVGDPGKSNRGKIALSGVVLRSDDDPGEPPALHAGQRYRAYYACHSLELLSIEALE